MDKKQNTPEQSKGWVLIQLAKLKNILIRGFERTGEYYTPLVKPDQFTRQNQEERDVTKNQVVSKRYEKPISPNQVIKESQQAVNDDSSDAIKETNAAKK